MHRTYTITDENAALAGEVSKDHVHFTNKKDARKAIAKRNRDGKNYACYIYEDGQRADNGCVDAKSRIMGVG